jgi:hypothetical protein
VIVLVCRAIYQELAGQTVSLKDIIPARNERRRQVHAGLSTRAQIVEAFWPASPAEAQPMEPDPPPSPPQNCHSAGRRCKERNRHLMSANGGGELPKPAGRTYRAAPPGQPSRCNSSPTSQAARAAIASTGNRRLPRRVRRTTSGGIA